MTELGEVRVSGGGAASPVWLCILADAFGLPVRVVRTAEAAALGAALLAATSQGAFASVTEACTAAVAVGPALEPGPGAVAAAESYTVYRELYPALRGSFARLSALDR